MKLIIWSDTKDLLPDGMYLMCRTDDMLTNNHAYPVIYVRANHWNNGDYLQHIETLDEQVRLFGPIPELEQ